MSSKWRGFSVQYSRLKLPAEYEFAWNGQWHYLAYHDLVLEDGEMQVTGERPVAGKDLRDRMTYIPAGQTIDGWAKPADRMNAFTVVCFDPAAMEEEIQAEFNDFDPRASVYFKDAHLSVTMQKLGSLLGDTERPASRIYAETVGLTAALEMFRITVAQAGAKSEKGLGQLSRSQCELLTSYIEVHLADDIGLDELAGLCGVTRFHFCRAFKATFGETPFHYVTLCRIERARQMLAKTRLPVSNIATACGFNGASQFGRAFRSIVGTTPLVYRRSS
ncbi:MAG: AraC family transcriptional regulator [Rhizobium sp.]|nr:AraC family transcriptional regulator [Rhizobium sp.]